MHSTRKRATRRAFLFTSISAPVAPPPAPAAVLAASRNHLALGQGDDLSEFGEGIGLVRHCHGVDEELLEIALERGFDLLDLLDRRLDLAAVVAVEQRHQRAGAGGIADGLDLREVAIR